MRRPEGFERPLDERAERERDEPERDAGRDLTAEMREVVRLDALRRRRDDLQRWAAEPSTPAEPRRWALSAYADLDVDEARDADPPIDAPADAEGDSLDVLEGGSHAQRVDRAWRAAERDQRRLDRAAAREAKRDARAAKRARIRSERAEVRRFTAARRRQLRIGLAAVGGLALALVLLVGLVWSPLMAVREVRVEGTERIDPAAVRAALADQVGEPIATVTEAGVAERLGAIPQIESFRLDVVPPSTVIVRLVERRPVALVETEAGTAAIDAAGVTLGAVDESTQALPRLDGVEVGSAQFEAVATVLVSVPSAVLEATESIAAPTPSDIRLSLATGQTVQWGGAEQSPLKADVVAALMETQDPGAAAVLDVRAPEHPVVRGPAPEGS